MVGISAVNWCRVSTKNCTDIFVKSNNTELGKKACTLFGEICSCSCLPVLPGPAGDLLSRICMPYFQAL